MRSPPSGVNKQQPESITQACNSDMRHPVQKHEEGCTSQGVIKSNVSRQPLQREPVVRSRRGQQEGVRDGGGT